MAVIGYLEVELHIPHSHSLKEKRGVVKRVLERLRNKFNVSVSEIENQNSWQSSVIGIVAIGTSKKIVDATLEKSILFIEELYPGFVVSYHKEFI
ncbi:DUF503 domain-containing protein [Thermovibrio sp.]